MEENTIVEGNKLMSNTLFGDIRDPEIIRTMGFYQPFATAMLHGKVETRWVQKGKKPPFPLGKYLMYSTRKSCSHIDLLGWCDNSNINKLSEIQSNDLTANLNGFAICTGILQKVEPLTVNHANTFIRFVGEKTIEKFGDIKHYVQWALIFDNIQPIEPFMWNYGKQGVGFLPESELKKIQPTTII